MELYSKERTNAESGVSLHCALSDMCAPFKIIGDTGGYTKIRVARYLL